MNNLLVKTVIGFIQLLLMLGLSLFLSAGSLRYWQGWLFLGTFSLCTIAITLYLIRFDQKLLASRVQAGPTAETQKNQKIIQSIASVAFISLLVVPGLDYRFHWSAIPPAVVIFANSMIALSFLLVFLVFKENSYTSAVIEVADQQKVITTGPYSVVRHPMYGGALLLIFFMPIALGSWIAIIASFILTFVIALRAVDEEKFLAQNLAGYEAYRQKVRYRFVPFVW